MSGFCPDEWHQTTETDLQQMALGSGDYEYAVWEALVFPLRPTRRSTALDELERKQKIVTDKAHAMAERLGLIPYSEETFERLMQEVERDDARAAQAIEAQRAETGTGSVHESAVPNGNAP